MHESLGKAAACFQVIVFFADRISNKSLILFLTSSIEWQNATESNKSHIGPSFPLTSSDFEMERFLMDRQLH